MSNPRRKCKLSDAKYKDIDLRNFSELIIDTVNKTVPNKNPKVFKTYFSTDLLNQSEAVTLGRALAKIEELSIYGKQITTFRLFEGKTYSNEESNIPTPKKLVPKSNQPKGGRMR